MSPARSLPPRRAATPPTWPVDGDTSPRPTPSTRRHGQLAAAQRRRAGDVLAGRGRRGQPAGPDHRRVRRARRPRHGRLPRPVPADGRPTPGPQRPSGRRTRPSARSAGQPPPPCPTLPGDRLRRRRHRPGGPGDQVADRPRDRCHRHADHDQGPRPAADLHLRGALARRRAAQQAVHDHRGRRRRRRQALRRRRYPATGDPAAAPGDRHRHPAGGQVWYTADGCRAFVTDMPATPPSSTRRRSPSPRRTVLNWVAFDAAGNTRSSPSPSGRRLPAPAPPTGVTAATAGRVRHRELDPDDRCPDYHVRITATPAPAPRSWRGQHHAATAQVRPLVADTAYTFTVARRTPRARARPPHRGDRHPTVTTAAGHDRHRAAGRPATSGSSAPPRHRWARSPDRRRRRRPDHRAATPAPVAPRRTRTSTSGSVTARPRDQPGPDLRDRDGTGVLGTVDRSP